MKHEIKNRVTGDVQFPAASARRDLTDLGLVTVRTIQPNDLIPSDVGPA